MTQIDPTDDDGQTEGGRLRERLEQTLAQNRELQAKAEEADALRRELAFSKAGLPDTPMARFFQENYQGDPDNIREEATKLGLLGAAPQNTEVDAQVSQFEQMAQAPVGAQPPSLSEAQEKEMWDEFQKTLRLGGDSEAVLRRYGRVVASDER